MKPNVCTIILSIAFAGFFLFFFFIILHIPLTIQIRLVDFHEFLEY